ncbi:hypothetical protein Tco_0663924 [Tanacetum coccineum]
MGTWGGGVWRRVDERWVRAGGGGEGGGGDLERGELLWGVFANSGTGWTWVFVERGVEFRIRLLCLVDCIDDSSFTSGIFMDRWDVLRDCGLARGGDFGVGGRAEVGWGGGGIGCGGGWMGVAGFYEGLRGGVGASWCHGL